MCIIGGECSVRLPSFDVVCVGAGVPKSCDVLLRGELGRCPGALVTSWVAGKPGCLFAFPRGGAGDDYLFGDSSAT